MPLLLLKWSLQFLLFCCWRHINRLLDTAFPNKTFLGAFSIISGFPDETTSFVIYLPQVKSVVKVRNDKTFLKSEINISSHGIYPFLLSSPITCQLYWMSVGMTITMLLVRCLGQTFFFYFRNRKIHAKCKWQFLEAVISRSMWAGSSAFTLCLICSLICTAWEFVYPIGAAGMPSLISEPSLFRIFCLVWRPVILQTFITRLGLLMPLASCAQKLPVFLSLFSMKAATVGLLKLYHSSQCNKAPRKKGQFLAFYGNIKKQGN